MEDDKLAAEEARRAAQHESVKAQVKADVNAEIAARAESAATPTQAREIEQAASGFRGEAVSEVVETEREVKQARSAARISQVVDYIFYVIYALLGLRLLLALLAARRSAGFTQFIYAVTDPFYAPFRGIVAEPTAEGGSRLAFSVIIAIIVYALLHAAINGVLRLLAHRKTEV